MSDTDRADPGLFPDFAANPSAASRRSQTEQPGFAAGVLFHLSSLGIVAAVIIVTFAVISFPLLDLRKKEPANSAIDMLREISSDRGAAQVQLERSPIGPGQLVTPTASSVSALGGSQLPAAAPVISETKSAGSGLVEPPPSSPGHSGARSEIRLQAGRPLQLLVPRELTRENAKSAPSDGSQGEASAGSAIPSDRRNEIFRDFERRNEIFREFAIQLNQEARPDPSPATPQRPPAQTSRTDDASAKSRIRKECGPIRDAATRRVCVSLLGSHGPGR
jgi:hypothetical protein